MKKSTVEVRVSHQFRVPAERVYDAWLDPAQVRAWMYASLKSLGLTGDIRAIDIDPRTGGKFLFSDQRGEVEARHHGTYLELERPRKIVFTWIVGESDEADPSRVTVMIDPQGTGCVATLVHEIDAKWADFVSQTEAGWARMLQQIDGLLNGEC